MIKWAVVPVKPLNLSKSRLADALSAEQRLLLSSYLLERTLQTLQQVTSIKQILVASRDSQALAIARRYAAQTLQEKSDVNLNTGLNRVGRLLLRMRVDGAIVIPIDLPRLTPQDIDGMLAMGKGEDVAVIAPDRHGDGTNAFYLRPPGIIQYSYGPGSFERHCGLLHAAGVETHIYESASIAFDLDTPTDLAELDSSLLSALEAPYPS